MAPGNQGGPATTISTAPTVLNAPLPTTRPACSTGCKIVRVNMDAVTYCPRVSNNETRKTLKELLPALSTRPPAAMRLAASGNNRMAIRAPIRTKMVIPPVPMADEVVEDAGEEKHVLSGSRSIFRSLQEY
ncbi:hypothetical protein B0A55_09292 [Friedmanniomyces simplex]|uniref:Uncharacterized protein n=1 Tax=Friedmanniomyces simplex TaxID=329884 RepID=A0A4U0WMF7_9PEZI|nr:hypothetical protein B0A55_09292 [Friedmanniomyces simplex]